MEFFNDMGVYNRVRRSQLRGKLITSRWIDIHKGNILCPNDRRRLVGKELNTYTDDSLYASCPPLEALRLITSRAATHDRFHRQNMMNDVRRAYVYAKATRDLYIELPKEDPHSKRGDMVGKLKLCLYWTRDAALKWQETLSQHLIDDGSVRGVGFSERLRAQGEGHLGVGECGRLLPDRKRDIPMMA